MSIPVTCSCGKAGTFPDELAGQRVRCGQCQALLQVPTFVPSAAVATPQPTRPAGRRARRVALTLAMLVVAGGAFSVGRWSVRPSTALVSPVVQAQRPPVRTNHLDWPPQLVAAEAHLKRFSNNPAVFEVVDWRPPAAYVNGNDDFPSDEAMSIVVRSQNNVGAQVVDRVLVYFSNGQVSKVRGNDNPLHFRVYEAQIYGGKDSNPLGQEMHELAKGAQGGKRAMPKPQGVTRRPLSRSGP